MPLGQLFDARKLSKIAGEPVSRIDSSAIDSTQVVDSAPEESVNGVNLDSQVRILATTLPQFFLWILPS